MFFPVIVIRITIVLTIVRTHGKKQGYVRITCQVEYFGQQPIMLCQSFIIYKIMIRNKYVFDHGVLPDQVLEFNQSQSFQKKFDIRMLSTP